MNQKAFFISSAIVLIIATSVSIGFGQIINGDINGDKKIDLKEAIYALQVTAGLKPATSFALQSNAFADGEAIPKKYACDGENKSPALSWTDAPAGTKSFVLIVDDPDAISVAGIIWDHWIVYDIPSSISFLAENAGATGGANLPSGAKHGKNSYARLCYDGPCPPSGTHHYYFKLYALDVETINPLNTKKEGIDAAMRGHVLGETVLMGTYVILP